MAKPSWFSAAIGLLLALLPAGADGQRIYFPSAIPEGSTAGATAPAPTAAPSSPPMTTYQPATPPVVMPAPALPTAVPPSAAPLGGAAGTTQWPSGGPSAAFQGGIQPPPSWDPYGAPGLQPPSLFPQDPYFSSGLGSAFGIGTPATRLLREIRLEHHWFANTDPKPFGINDIDFYGTFAIPFLYNQQTPLLVTPGFSIHLWDGPITTPADPADLPPVAYDAYLDAAWNPQVNPWLGGALSVRVGVYSDFSKVVEDSLRLTGKGMAVLSFSPSFKITAGVWYLDRIRVKLMPAGGIIWTPSNDVRFDILFPNPKFTKRIATIGTTDWRVMLRGEYGGGNWTVKRAFAPMEGQIDNVDYNDIRVATGLEFDRTGGIHGMFEVGVAFEREILYRSRMPERYLPTTTVFLGGAVAY